jgi:hypothetical protein
MLHCYSYLHVTLLLEVNRNECDAKRCCFFWQVAPTTAGFASISRSLEQGRVTKLGVNFRAVGPVRLALYTETGVVTLPTVIAQTNEYTAQVGENEFPVVDINAGQYRVVAQGSLIDHAQESTGQGWYKPGVTPFVDFTPNLVVTNRAYPYSSLSWVVQECFSGEACQGTTCVCPPLTCDAHPFCGINSSACGQVNCTAQCTAGENCQGSTCVSNPDLRPLSLLRDENQCVHGKRELFIAVHESVRVQHSAATVRVSSEPVSGTSVLRSFQQLVRLDDELPAPVPAR